jgi:hypothetical protein
MKAAVLRAVGSPISITCLRGATGGCDYTAEADRRLSANAIRPTIKAAAKSTTTQPPASAPAEGSCDGEAAATAEPSGDAEATTEASGDVVTAGDAVGARLTVKSVKSGPSV